MNKGHLYRLQQIHEIEKQIRFDKIKQESVVKKYHRVINLVMFVSYLFSFVCFCWMSAFYPIFKKS